MTTATTPRIHFMSNAYDDAGLRVGRAACGRSLYAYHLPQWTNDRKRVTCQACLKAMER